MGVLVTCDLRKSGLGSFRRITGTACAAILVCIPYGCGREAASSSDDLLKPGQKGQRYYAPACSSNEHAVTFFVRDGKPKYIAFDNRFPAQVWEVSPLIAKTPLDLIDYSFTHSNLTSIDGRPKREIPLRVLEAAMESLNPQIQCEKTCDGKMEITENQKYLSIGNPVIGLDFSKFTQHRVYVTCDTNNLPVIVGRPWIQR